MKIACVSSEELVEGVYKVSLKGRLSIAGCDEIDIQFSGMTASPRKYIIVDISEVIFLSSLGIRMILLVARAVEGRGGKLVLLNPNQSIEKALKLSGIPEIITVSNTLSEAMVAITSE